jgi:Rha family phage regulatory protein
MNATSNVVRLREIEGVIYASSRHVAEDFGKDHWKVTKDIEALIKEIPPNLAASWFRDDEYFDRYQRKQSCIDMTRQGWELVVMNYRGMVPWKVAYVLKFEEMETKLGPQGARTAALFDRTNPAFEGPPKLQPGLFDTIVEPLAHNAFEREVWIEQLEDQQGISYVIIKERNELGNVGSIELVRHPFIQTSTQKQQWFPWINGSQVLLKFNHIIPLAIFERVYFNQLPESPQKAIARETLDWFLAL